MSLIVAAQEKIICTKWCHITIEEIIFLVVWKFENVENQYQATDGDDITNHTLPLRVLGVSCKNRQIHLKCASQKLKRNEKVQIMINWSQIMIMTKMQLYIKPTFVYLQSNANYL